MQYVYLLLLISLISACGTSDEPTTTSPNEFEAQQLGNLAENPEAPDSAESPSVSDGENTSTDSNSNPGSSDEATTDAEVIAVEGDSDDFGCDVPMCWSKLLHSSLLCAAQTWRHLKTSKSFDFGV